MGRSTVIFGTDTAIGTALLDHLSKDPENTVLGLTLEDTDPSNLEHLNDLGIYLSSNPSHYIVNCYNNFDKHTMSKELYLEMANNLIDFSIQMGLRYVHISSLQVFSGSGSAYASDSALDPVTLLGQAHKEIEESIKSKYQQLGINNYLILRFPWIYGYSDYTPCKYDFNLALDLNKVVSENNIDVPTNVFSTPVLAEVSAIDVGDLIAHAVMGKTINMGTTEETSLHDFAISFFSGSGVTINSYNITDSVFVDSDPILGDHPVNNTVPKAYFSIIDDEGTDINLIKADIHISCFHNKNLESLPYFISELYNMPEDGIPELLAASDKKQWLLDLEANGQVLQHYGSVEQYNSDLTIVDYFFPTSD